MSKAWEVLTSESILEHPLLTVSIEQVRLPNGDIIADWPKVQGRDLVNAAVFNGDGKVLVWEAYQHGTGWVVWQIVNGYVGVGEDPLTAVKRELETAGYTCEDWVYMGSYVADAHQHVGVGHFFSTRHAVAIPNFEPIYQDRTPKWVSLQELRHALVDGRLATINSAMCVALSLLTL
jgi:hypothetical protein